MRAKRPASERERAVCPGKTLAKSAEMLKNRLFFIIRKAT